MVSFEHASSQEVLVFAGASEKTSAYIHFETHGRTPDIAIPTKAKNIATFMRNIGR